MPQLRALILHVLFASLVVGGLHGCGDDDGPSDTPDGGTPDGGDDGAFCPEVTAECGNGVVEPGESCDPPDGETCDDDCQRIPEVEPDPACDLTGHWAVEKVTISSASIAGVGDLEGVTFNRMYYHIVQDGEQIEVVDSLECGLFVEAAGAVPVDISSDTAEALRCMVDSDGRTGTARVSDDQCEIAFDTHYTVRGLSPLEYWLDDDWAPDTMEPSAPSKAAPMDPNCTCTTTSCDCDDTGRYDPDTDEPGWEDWDRDGAPGITMRPGNARWHLHLRDWDRFQGTVPQATEGEPHEEVVLDVEWWNVQGLMAHTEGSIVADEEPDVDADHHVTLQRLETPDRNAISDFELCQTVLSTFAE